jgi:bifunctional non-homologous end joining protein LigD
MKKLKTIKAVFSFVIHYHKTVRPHYDLRLEINGTMPSWAIPKGPSLDPAVKRLAMETTEHDMDYRNFEGVIPEGAYGAGAVMIWDEGTYTAEHEISKGVREQIADPAKAQNVMLRGLQKGEIKFILHGKKLNGSFALVKTRGFGPKNAWLLIKHKDDDCVSGYEASRFPASARSNRTIDEIH